MMPFGCRIVKDFQRPAPELVERFRNLATANIDDNLGRIGAVDSGIKPIGKGRLLGTAFTIRVPAGDNLMFHAAMDMAKPGDVIVIDAGGFTERAILGALMAAYCKRRGICGIVCDGAVRDRDDLAEMTEFPVYARAVTPNGPYKNGPGEINLPVVIGGRTVYPGDIVVGDGDGLVFIPPAIAGAVAEASLQVAEKEDAIMGNIQENCRFIRPWVEEKLKAIQCEITE